MTIGDRIKKVREEKELTQQAFADALRIHRQTIASYERGIIAPRDRMITDICREFDVNPEWLQTGEGDMFMEKSLDEEILAVMGDILSSGDDFLKRLLFAMSRMKPEKRKLVEEKVMELTEIIERYNLESDQT